jgi:hypothetical protein
MKITCRECNQNIPEDFVDEYGEVVVGFCQNEWCRDGFKQQIQSHPNNLPTDNLGEWHKGVAI